MQSTKVTFVSDGRLIRVDTDSLHHVRVGILVDRGWLPWNIDSVLVALLRETSLSVSGALHYMVERDDWKANVLDDY